MFKNLMNASQLVVKPSAELLITRDRFNPTKPWELAWKIIVPISNPYDIRAFYVSAINGEVIDSFSMICGANSEGTAQTKYSGTRSLTSDSFLNGGNSAFRLREIRNGVSIKTINGQRLIDVPRMLQNPVDFVDNNNVWTSVEHQAFQDQVATDAHWAAEKVFDYWKTVQNRNSIDNNGLEMINIVHFDLNRPNAFWSLAHHAVLIGDGNSTIPPLATLDIMAHEFGHGVDEFESGLTSPGSTHAPIISESLADIWGAVIEFWAAPEKQRWLIGEDLGTALRSLSNPNQFGQPDTFKGTNWLDPEPGFPRAHLNSGVMNFWFFNLVMGGNVTNDLGACYNIAGIGMNRAAAIVYRAQTVYITPSATFQSVRTATIQAAIDLYGTSSQEVASVTNSWFAVGVGDQKRIDGIPIVCTSGAEQTFIGAPIGTPITWSVTPANLVTVSNGIGPVANLQASSSNTSGYATITFSTNTCTGSVFKPIWIGLPSSSISGNATPYPGQIYTYSSINIYDGAGPPYGWVVDGGVIFGGGGFSDNNVSVYWQNEGFVGLSTFNACGEKSNILEITPSTEGGCAPCAIVDVYPIRLQKRFTLN